MKGSFVALILSVFIISAFGQVKSLLSNLNDSHDVTVPEWGPYTKKYMGISHITDQVQGIRFDLSIMPGFYRQKVVVPNVLYESGYYPWDASADLNYYSFRQELEWKDRVYTDVSFAPFNSNARLLKVACVNKTDVSQNLVVHLLGSINFADINPLKAILPQGARWLSGIDYQTMNFAKARPQDNLTYDGFTKGELRGHQFVNGSALATSFGKDKGDNVVYQFKLDKIIKNPVLLIRYRVGKDSIARFHANGIYKGQIDFRGKGEITTMQLPLKLDKTTSLNLELNSEGTGEIELDGFAIVEENEFSSIRFKTSDNPVPEIFESAEGKYVLLKYPEIDKYYGIAWQHESSVIRQFHNDLVDVALPLTVNNHGHKEFFGSGNGHFTDVFIRPIPLKPHQSENLYALVASGSKAEIENSFRQFSEAQDFSPYFQKYLDQISQQPVNSEGRKFAFGNQIIKATTLQNVVFPVYTNRQYIKHFTPGRWWNSLYTWDSGFIGLGMATIDTLKAIEILNTYTTNAEDPNAFIHHGSMVPVQFFLFQDLLNRTHSKELLNYFYPRLKKYYLFYTGQFGSSTMRMKFSDLIRPWDYFYNSGGWDDYPPQKYIRGDKYQYSIIAPVINTSMAIRIAKIMTEAAVQSGNTADLKLFESDIKQFSTSLQKYSWDKSSGYFGYVKHDERGKPKDILRTEGGVNFNMGLDGAFPLVAGICTDEQRKTLLNSFFSDKKLWTPVGITAVDQSAPYYTTEGYWNGTVWFPHQWFFWKTMFDLGEGDKATKIALTALNTWKKEAELTYHSAEHFSVETGRGAGWHQFSALSTPVMMWFNAYFRPGSITTGFDAAIVSHTFSKDNTVLNAKIKFSQLKDHADVLVCLKEDEKYAVTVNNKAVSYTEVVKGGLKISIPESAGKIIDLKINIKE